MNLLHQTLQILVGAELQWINSPILTKFHPFEQSSTRFEQFVIHLNEFYHNIFGRIIIVVASELQWPTIFGVFGTVIEHINNQSTLR
jgi:hypothetical protein